MADPRTLEQDAVKFATRAVTCDQNGLTDTAIFYYREAAQALLSASMAGSTYPGLLDKAQEYVSHAEKLKSIGTAKVQLKVKTPEQLQLERAHFLVNQAFEEDECGSQEEAIELYMQAAESCLKLKQNSLSEEMMRKVKTLALQAISRAEELKGSDGRRPTSHTASDRSSSTTSRAGTQGEQRVVRPLGLLLRDDPADKETQAAAPASSTSAASAGYTKEEINVLRKTSTINGCDYVPFMSVDVRERFAYPLPFCDKQGKLALSPKQQSKLHQWMRPDEFLDNPTMIYAVSSFSIKQTVVSDCSFVASLAISAQYERKFKKKLITSIIYPQNRQGEPQYNPCGKYMVKLHLNGVHRKVIIDDLLPMGRNGELLCSHSSNKSELWVSLLEKAYLKVMGGYNFPGSNSNIDLHALTGWIPERVSLRSTDSDFNADKEFDRIRDRFHKGHCLVTLATGELTEAAADRAGLVPTHAYAMLDIRKVKGVSLFQLKNPWSHLRWKGNYSENDLHHWTPDMKKLLNYDPKAAETYDNGVFWIDYESVKKFFDLIYINWNPELFAHTTCLHHTWTAREGPKKDFYNIGENPQYRLEVKGSGSRAVWILLTRHITDKDDFADNKEFITVMVYKTQGNRVFYPYDTPPCFAGVRINSPHYLCQLTENTEKNSLYTLVISQYEKSNTIHYTLRVYATCDFKLSKICEPYNPSYEKRVTGQWKGFTAGGCPNHRNTFHNNPIYQLSIQNNNTNNYIMIELKGPRQYSVGLEIVTVSETVSNAVGSFKKKDSGEYRRGFCVLQLENIPGGVYNIRVSTFLPAQEGPFILSVSSSAHISLVPLCTS